MVPDTWLISTCNIIESCLGVVNINCNRMFYWRNWIWFNATRRTWNSSFSFCSSFGRFNFQNISCAFMLEAGINWCLHGLKSKPRKIKLLPQKLGDSVIFSKSGLSAFWTNILPMLSSCTIYLGKLIRYRLRLHVTARKTNFFRYFSGALLWRKDSSIQGKSMWRAFWNISLSLTGVLISGSSQSNVRTGHFWPRNEKISQKN